MPCLIALEVSEECVSLRLEQEVVERLSLSGVGVSMSEVLQTTVW